MIRNRFTVVVLALLLALGLASCTKQRNAEQKADRELAERQLKGFQENQPAPVFTYSQLRQNLIEITTATAQTTQTTTFFFNMGVADPIGSCPSIGFPIPSTAQITAPETKLRNTEAVVPQIEANGVYTGDSSGTYIMCVDAQGRPYANYWEGFVQTVTGAAKWNPAIKQVELVGPPSFEFSKTRKGQ